MVFKGIQYKKWPVDISKNEFIKDTFYLTNARLSLKYGRSVRNILYLKAWIRGAGEVHGHAGFPAATGHVWTDWLRRKCNRFIVMADSHIPNHDAEMFVYIIDLARKWKIPTLVIAGDFASMNTMNPHKKRSPSVEVYDEHADMAILTIERFLNDFQEVIYLQGNHEAWLTYGTNGQISFGREFKKIPGCTFSQYPFADITSAGEVIRIGHPKEFSRIAASVPRRLSPIHQCHLITGHNHTQSFTWSPDGTHWQVEAGHCLSPEHTEYKMTTFSTHPQWNPGFVVVWDAWPYLIHPRNIDFYLSSFKPPKEKPSAQK